MVEVGEADFGQWFPEIENAIRNCSFVAVDLEFLGLPSSTHPKAVSLFDNPSERYLKLCDSIRRFPPCQIGVACFRENGNVFEVDIFCMHMFKRMCKRVFSFSLSAMTFLAQNNFDFNKFVGEGVTYSNRTEHAKLKRDIIAGTFDYDEFTDGLAHRMQMLKMRIFLEATVDDARMRRDSESAERASFCRDERVRLARPLLIELCAREDAEEEEYSPGHDPSDTYLWDNCLTSVEEAAVVYVLSEEFPHFDFQIDHSRTLLYVAERPLIFRNIGDRKRHKMLLKTLLNEISGVSRIFHCISEQKKPLVGHNSLLDLMYIYNCFEGDLPGTYEEWKAAVAGAFPTIIDTKILAGGLQETLYKQGVTDSSLQTLGSYFESPSCGSVLPFDTPEIVPGPTMPGLFNGQEFFHNAGYDAYVTGQIFLKLTHLYAFTKCTTPTPMTSPWPLAKLLIILKTRIANKVPIPLIDTQHCNLVGDDPIGSRPDLIRVKKRRRVEWLERITQAKTIHAYCGRILDYFMKPLLLSEKECSKLRDDLIRIVGSFRVEVRRSEARDEALIATNTAKSYARVCLTYASNKNYYLADEGYFHPKTFEQRLTVSREKKDLTAPSEQPKPVRRRQPNLVSAASVGALISMTIFIIKKHAFND